MSSDNGIYIIYFPEGYRVAHAQAIENIDYFPPGTIERKQELKKYFGKSKIFQSYKDAFTEAEKLANEILKDDFCPILEYGICYLGDEYESFLE
jgi:hypothetical protein